jgi:hypothetical protein
MMGIHFEHKKVSHIAPEGGGVAQAEWDCYLSENTSSFWPLEPVLSALEAIKYAAETVSQKGSRVCGFDLVDR